MSYDHRDAVNKIRAFPYNDEDGNVKWFTATDKAVLSNLADRATKEDEKCHPGYGLIAEDTLCSRRAVIRSVALLKFLGFISIEAGTERLSNTYTVHLDAINKFVVEQQGKKSKKPKREGNFGQGETRISFKGKTYTRKPKPQFTLDDDDDDEPA